MAGVSLLASFLEGEERIVAELRGSGPIQLISAEALHVGEVRGHTVLQSEAPSRMDGALGHGVMRIAKVLYRLHQPVVSVVELQSGDVSSEFSHYMEKSEQVPSAVSFETVVDGNGEVEFSGGIIIQTMPKAPPELIPQARTLIAGHSMVHNFLDKKKSLYDLLDLLVPEKITEGIERTQVDFFCRCGIGNFKLKMSALGHDELRHMQKEGLREVKCVNCSKLYHMSDKDFDDMHKILEEKEMEANKAVP